MVVNKIFLFSEKHFRVYVYVFSLEKIFEIVQENTLKCSKLIPFLGNKKSSLNQIVSRRKYPKMFKTDFIFRQQKTKLKPSLNQIVRRD